MRHSLVKIPDLFRNPSLHTYLSHTPYCDHTDATLGYILIRTFAKCFKFQFVLTDRYKVTDKQIHTMSLSGHLKVSYNTIWCIETYCHASFMHFISTVNYLSYTHWLHIKSNLCTSASSVPSTTWGEGNWPFKLTMQLADILMWSQQEGQVSLPVGNKYQSPWQRSPSGDLPSE